MDRLTHVRWAGYQIHSDFWLLRDFQSKTAEGRGYSDLLKSGQSSKMSLKEQLTSNDFQKAKIEELLNQAYREGSISNRSARVAVAGVLALAIAASAVAGLNHLSTGQSDSSSQNQSQGMKREIPETARSPMKGTAQVSFKVESLVGSTHLPVYYSNLAHHNFPGNMTDEYNYSDVEPGLVDEVLIAPPSGYRIGYQDHLQSHHQSHSAVLKIFTYVPF